MAFIWQTPLPPPGQLRLLSLFLLAVHTQLHMRFDTLCARWKRRAVSPWVVVVLYGPDAFAMSVGLPDDDDPHPGPSVRTVYLDPFGDWEPEGLGYLYDRGLVVGAAQGVLAMVVNFWDVYCGSQARDAHHPGGQRGLLPRR